MGAEGNEVLPLVVVPLGAQPFGLLSRSRICSCSTSCMASAPDGRW